MAEAFLEPLPRFCCEPWSALLCVLAACAVPLVASGGAGTIAHFVDVFRDADVDAALAASVFHTGAIEIPLLKQRLHEETIEVRRV